MRSNVSTIKARLKLLPLLLALAICLPVMAAALPVPSMAADMPSGADSYTTSESDAGTDTSSESDAGTDTSSESAAPSDPGGLSTPETVYEAGDYDVATAGRLNGIVLMAKVTEVGVKFDWIPGGAKLGYRIYRSASPGDEGISISDFAISGNQYVDVNVKPDTRYYYTIRVVEAEASVDKTTFEVVREAVGEASEELAVTTAAIVTRDVQRQFILMMIGKDTMRVNEKTKEIDPGRGTTPLVVDSRTLVPIRAIVESMGGTVGWDESAPDDIALSAYGHDVKMTLNAGTIVADGVTKEIDVPPQTINNRTMVPVRFVAENIGCNIQWIGSTQEIIIVYYE